jgi:hypothetical protein
MSIALVRSLLSRLLGGQARKLIPCRVPKHVAPSPPRGNPRPIHARKVRAPWMWAGLACCLACTPWPASATLIATDHFLGDIPGDPAAGQYDLTSFRNQLRRGEANGGGQDPTVAGFVGPWSGNVTSGTLGVAQWTVNLDPLGSTLSYQQGGRARFAGVDNLQRRVQRELAPYTASDTYYISLVSQVLTGDTDLDGFVGIGFTNTAASVAETDANIIGGNGLRGLLIGPAGNGTGTDYVVRHVGSSGMLQDDVLLSDIVQNDEEGSPFVRYTVVKLDFNDDPGNPEGNSQLTIWQDPIDISSEAAATAASAPLVLRTFALGTNADLTHLTFAGVDYSRAASFDEPRLATTWESATGGTADFNGDGNVDGADFLIWQRNFGLTDGATLADGDGTGDGSVGDADFAFWESRFGSITIPVPALAAAVPEPTAAMLMVLGFAAAGVAGRRHR